MISYTNEEIEGFRHETIQEMGGEPLVEVDGYTLHEALHASDMIMNNIVDGLVDHPAVYSDESAFKFAYDAHTALFNLYQYLGSKKY